GDCLLGMRKFWVLLGVFWGWVGVVQDMECGGGVQGGSSVLIRKSRRRRTYMFLSYVEKQCGPAEG
ncbi:hypothetical protein, partial [Salmonella enterica]|uniref:hypothetical protein n=1 Tax=Salmonella enterica TaxID=28901 RepID=UPI00398C4534